MRSRLFPHSEREYLHEIGYAIPAWIILSPAGIAGTCCLALGPEEGHEPCRYSGLRVHHIGIAFVEEGLV